MTILRAVPQRAIDPGAAFRHIDHDTKPRSYGKLREPEIVTVHSKEEWSLLSDVSASQPQFQLGTLLNQEPHFLFHSAPEFTRQKEEYEQHGFRQETDLYLRELAINLEIDDVSDLLKYANMVPKQKQNLIRMILQAYSRDAPISDAISREWTNERMAWAELRKELDQFLDEYQDFFDQMEDRVPDVDEMKRDYVKVFLRNKLPLLE